MFLAVLTAICDTFALLHGSRHMNAPGLPYIRKEGWSLCN